MCSTIIADARGLLPECRIAPKPLCENMRGREVRELLADALVDLGDGRRVAIPAHFQTDGASIPRAFWGLVGRPFARDIFPAALAHDWLYYTHLTPGHNWTRAEADAMLRDTLAASGVGRVRRNLIYRSVRLFGGDHWANDAEDLRYLGLLRQQVLNAGGCPASYGLA